MLSGTFWVQCKMINCKNKKSHTSINLSELTMENSSQKNTEQGLSVGWEEQGKGRVGGCEIWKTDVVRCPFCGHGSETVFGGYTGHDSWWPTFIPCKCNLWSRWPHRLHYSSIDDWRQNFFILSALRLLVFHLCIQIKKRFSPVYPSCFENLFNNFSLVNIIVYIRTVCKHWTFVFQMLMFY